MSIDSSSYRNDRDEFDESSITFIRFNCNLFHPVSVQLHRERLSFY